MRNNVRWISGVAVGSLAMLLAMTVGSRVAEGQAEHVSWDIVSLNFPTTTISPGGTAFAQAPNHISPAILWRIKLTGSGTFVAPASGGRSNAVTGGGTWETFVGNTSTGRGTYWVTGLASWEFANFAVGGPPIDLTGDRDARANGNAVLRIRYSDGSTGTLGVGCHGPGAPNGIVEGVIATKGFVTYWNAEPPVANVDLNRTLFHVE